MRRAPVGPDMPDIWERLNARALAQTKAVHREGKLRRRLNSKSSWTPARQTLFEIGALIQARHGGACDTDDGELYLTAALPWLLDAGGGLDAEDCRATVLEWVSALVPRVTNATVDAGLAEARRRDERKCLYWSAARLGEILRLSIEEREHLGIRRIRPAGQTDAEFKAYQRQRKTENERARRRANGARPREQSAAQMKPWDALNLSRREYYRRKAAGTLPGQIRDAERAARVAGTNSCPLDPKDLQPTSKQCHGTGSSVAGPAREASPKQTVGAGGLSPKAKARAVVAGHARALPLPMEGFQEQPDFFGSDDAWISLGSALDYAGGVMPPEIARAVRLAQRARLMTQEAVARHVGISRPQLANALKGRFGLSRSAAENLMQWLAA